MLVLASAGCGSGTVGHGPRIERTFDVDWQDHAAAQKISYTARHLVFRTQVAELRNREFVEAAVMIGARDSRILRTHVLPRDRSTHHLDFALGRGRRTLRARLAARTRPRV